MGMTPQISDLWGKLWETCHLNHSLGKRARYPRAIKSIVFFENSQCSWPKTSLGYCCRPASITLAVIPLPSMAPSTACLWGIDFSELSWLLRLFCVNSHPCKTAGNTSGLLKWGTMINHSCLPNVAGTAAFFLIGGWFIHIYTRHPVVKTCGMNLGVILCGWWADVSHVLPASRGAGAQASTEIPMAFWWSGMNVWEHIWYYNISYHK